MTKELGFYRQALSDIDGDGGYLWYADLVKELSHLGVTESACLMVKGADRWLENQAKGKDYITLTISNKDFDDKDGYLTRTDSNLFQWAGADYLDSQSSDSLWLCFVNWLFWGKHPLTIYYKLLD